MINRKHKKNEIVVSDKKENLVFEVRGKQVMLDRHVADQYEILTKNLNRQIQRNISEFKENDYFQLTKNELDSLSSRCQFVTAKNNQYLPYVLTKESVLRVSNHLNNQIAKDIINRMFETFPKLEQIVKEFIIPKTFSEALLLAANIQKELELKEIENKKQSLLLIEQQPKVNTFNKILNSNGLLSLNITAKTLKIGPNKFTELLRQDKILMSDPINKNVPYQQFILDKYFEVIPQTKIHKHFYKTFNVTYVTPKGLLLLQQKYSSSNSNLS